MDADRLRAMEAEAQQRVSREDVAAVESGAANPVASPVPPPPLMRERPVPFLWLSVRLGGVFVLLGGFILYDVLTSKPAGKPDGEIPLAIFRHYGAQGLAIASGLGGAGMLALGVCMLAYFFIRMPRRRR